MTRRAKGATMARIAGLRSGRMAVVGVYPRWPVVGGARHRGRDGGGRRGLAWRFDVGNRHATGPSGMHRPALRAVTRTAAFASVVLVAWSATGAPAMSDTAAGLSATRSMTPPPWMSSVPLERPDTMTGSPADPDRYAQQFRHTFGLDESLAAIQAARQHPAIRRHISYGTDLAQAEQDDLEARAVVQAADQQLTDAVARHGGHTAGLVIDQRNHGQFVVPALSSLTDGERADILASVPAGGSLRFVPATVAADALTAAMAAMNSAGSNGRPPSGVSGGLPVAGVSAASGPGDPAAGRFLTDLKAAGYTLGTYGPDLYGDVLSFTVAAYNGSQDANLHALWARDAGKLLPSSAVSFSYGGPGEPTDSRVDQPGQIKAGVAITVANGAGVSGCTTNIAGTDSQGRAKLITAGHCDPPTRAARPRPTTAILSGTSM